MWTPDGSALLFSANRHENNEYERVDTEIYEVSIVGGAVKALTTRKGPDQEPAVSPDGKLVAYTGFDDRYLTTGRASTSSTTTRATRRSATSA